MFPYLATASTLTGIDWSTVVTASSFQPLIDGFIAILPVAISVAIPMLVIRKGWDFLKGTIYSA